MLIFPTCFFGIYAKDVDILTSRISGGTSLSGIESSIATDGGGKWYANADNVNLHRREQIMAWRAFVAATSGGIDPFVFPICDARNQPVAGRLKVPHSDGTSFNDDTLYLSGSCEVVATLDTPLRATSMRMQFRSLGKPLIGGERFSIDHPTWRHRCYQVGRIEGDLIQFHPPLREAVTAGTAIDFNSPRFVAHAQGQMGAPLSNPRLASGSFNFVEDMTGSYAMAEAA